MLPFISFAESTEVPFTLEDRDRLIRLEENVQSLQYEIREFKAEMREFRAEIRADIRKLRIFFC